jgi:hypothetical protein
MLFLFILLDGAGAKALLKFTTSGLSSANFDIYQEDNGKRVPTSFQFQGYESVHYYRTSSTGSVSEEALINCEPYTSTTHDVHTRLVQLDPYTVQVTLSSTSQISSYLDIQDAITAHLGVNDTFRPKVRQFGHGNGFTISFKNSSYSFIARNSRYVMMLVVIGLARPMLDHLD